jgi:hypothetical protein
MPRCGWWPAQLAEGIKEIPDVSEITLLGGRRREVRVEIDPARLDAHGVDALQVAQALRGANARAAASTATRDGVATRIETGLWLDSTAAVEQVVVRSAAGLRPLRVGDVATVTDGHAEPDTYVRFHSRGEGTSPAVTIAIAKRKGTNAITSLAPRRGEARGAPPDLRARGPHHLGHPQLRRDGARQVERAALPHGPRRRVGVAPHLVRARPARVGVVAIAIP